MCDCYVARCEHPGCSNMIPVHIGDFCARRDTVHVRCSLHKPTETGWSAFRRPGRRATAYFRVDGYVFPIDRDHGICPNDGECVEEVLFVPKRREWVVADAN